MARFNKAIAALLLGATIAGAAATPAEAARYYGRGGHGYGYSRGYHGGYYGRGYYPRRGVSTGAAVGLGLLGVGIGAAIASQPRYYGGAPAYGYVGPSYYDSYYAPPPPPPVYYRSCVTRPVFDPYIGRTVPVESCN
ncbi:hypothetical protein [Sphingomonas quercus]|uniref:Uncharacterized protein n=1 Tax=Sphingomonas quercus TaxID=2842451 RepID=A0ABS6BLP1_9SPHN|nr:hypothetical protein [Sphingomonas quercus]MBU3079218.1 hypothetical protein [Sphingomonas quercus]